MMIGESSGMEEKKSYKPDKERLKEERIGRDTRPLRRTRTRK